MYLKIDKRGDTMKVEISMDPNVKPVPVTLTEKQAQALVSILTTALNAKVFSFTLDL